MHVITKRDVIRGVRDRHERQYARSADEEVIGHGEGRRPLGETRAALAALDLETATEAQVVAVLNHSWTSLSCDECGQQKEAVVHLGQGQDYDSRWLTLCGDCLSRAQSILTT